MERCLKKRTVAASAWLRRRGLRTSEVAKRMSMDPKTLEAWQDGWRKDRLHVRLRGRPPGGVDLATRNAVIGFLQLVGPGVGMPTLRAAFRDVPAAELERILHAYRKQYLGRGAHSVFALRWTRAGAVWAIDHTAPDLSVDGQFPWILVVRDLASGMQLEALPVVQKDMHAVAQALERLFRAFGAPLVLKADNAFNADEVRAVLAAWEVQLLLSPPYTPRYNGAIEAGIGSLKTRTHHEAARNDRPGEWTCDDVEAGRLAGNHLGRPRGADGPTPNEMWSARRPLDLAERAAFRARIEQSRQDLRAERGVLPGFDLGPRDEATLEREAIARALVARDILEVRRRSIPPPLFRLKVGKIS